MLPVTNHVCDSRSTIVDVTKVHCLCDVNRCYVCIGQRLQGSFSPTDVRTKTTFHVLLCKSALKCHVWSKEGVGTLAALYQTVRRWVNAVKIGREETDDTVAVQPHYRQWTNAIWRNWSLSLKAGAVFHPQLLQKSEYHQQVFTLSSPRAWGKSKVCAKWIPLVLKDDQVAKSAILATTLRQRCRNEDRASSIAF